MWTILYISGVHILLWTRKEELLERQTTLMSAMKSYLDNSTHSNNLGNSRRQHRQPKTQNTKQKSKTKTDQEMLKLKMKNSKK